MPTRQLGFPRQFLLQNQQPPQRSPPAEGTPWSLGKVAMGDKDNKGDPVMLNRVNGVGHGVPTPPKNSGYG